MRNIITTKDLCFSYDKQLVLNNLNVCFEEGKFSVILGRNGSGKSTFFNVLAGLEKKYAGTLLIADQERNKIKIGKKETVRIGFLNQFHQSTFPFKVKEVIMTGRASFSNFSPTAYDQECVEEILTKFDLHHLKDKAYTSLSGGERQLVLLCRVLVQKPDVLLLDEPTNHLDLHYQIAVLKCIKMLANEGTTVLCVMHDPNLAFLFGERFYVMCNNTLVDIQNLEQQELHKLLEDTYQIPLVMIENQGKQMFIPQI